MKTFIILIINLIVFSNIAFARPYWEFTEKELKGKKVSLFGSFSCYDKFIKIMDHFEYKGAIILSPIRSKIIDMNADFRLFKDDDLKNKTEKQLQETVFSNTKKYADIVYIVNGEGCKIGLGTASEIGYTIALNDLRSKKVPIYCWEKPHSSHIMFYCEY